MRTHTTAVRLSLTLTLLTVGGFACQDATAPNRAEPVDPRSADARMAREGKRSHPVFCPNGPAGTYPTLPEAIAAAEVNGTVLVCDGEHTVDQVSLNKPLTLRSQNRGGATIADADPSQVWQAGRPALVVDGVASGVVRILDLAFLVGNRAVFAGGTFDRLEIDRVHFRGRTMTVPIAVWVDASTVATAKVEITDSRFETLSIGVFTVRGVETDIRSSSFDAFANSSVGFGSAITYSSNPLNNVPSASYGRAEHSTFSNCAPGGCVRVVGQAVAGRDVVIAHNEMSRPTGSSQSQVIFAGRTGTSPIDLVTVEYNQITGAPPSGDPAARTSWTVQSFVNAANATRVNVHDNRVSNVHTAIIASQNVAARDNVLRGGFYAVAQQNSSAIVDFQRNDVLRFTSSIFRVSAGGDAGNYRCNWWGSTAGPTAPSPNVQASSYTPWATEPIAGTSISCDGSAP
jgi:hypothetical protein